MSLYFCPWLDRTTGPLNDGENHGMKTYSVFLQVFDKKKEINGLWFISNLVEVTKERAEAGVSLISNVGSPNARLLVVLADSQQAKNLLPLCKKTKAPRKVFVGGRFPA